MEIPEVLLISDTLDSLVDNRSSFLLAKSCSMDSRLLGKRRHRTVLQETSGEPRRRNRSARQKHYESTTMVDDGSSRQGTFGAESSSTGDWIFEQVGALSCKSSSSPDVISSIDYDDNNKLVATGGLARKVRICSYQALMGTEVPKKNLFTTICMPAKLSGLKWKPGNSEVVGCGDYDGAVTEWDVEHGVSVSERHDHSGRTVWSIDYRRDSTGFMASASSDTTVRFWSNNVEKNVGMIKSPKGNSMCSVEFNRWNPHQVAIGCGDASVYIYDLRNLSSEVLDLRGHERSVGYVRWLGNYNLVSSSPDGSIRLWDLDASSRDDICRRSFRCHTNVRNFVGLSVTDAGLIASGSETNEVFVYDAKNESPIFQQEFSKVETTLDVKPFVGSVCWTRQEDHLSLVSANSEGNLKVIKAVPRF